MTTRRTLLEAAVLMGSAGAPAPSFAAGADAGSGGATFSFSDRASMAARGDLPAGTAALLTEPGREGVFVLRAGPAPADPLQGLSVGLSGNRGHWARLWDGIHGNPGWFGAASNRPELAARNRAAIQACIDLCPTTVLGAGDWHVDGRLLVTRNGASIIGAGHTQTDQTSNDAGKVTRIVSSNPRDTIIQVGSDDSGKPRDLTETVRLEGFTVDRSVSPFTPASGVAGAIGVALRWCVNCHLERVFSINSARGFFYYGVVETYTRFCGALRWREGSNGANDCFVGFHFDYSAPSGYNGGNASVYLVYCRAFPLTEDATPRLTYSAGIRFDGGWVDCNLHGFETGGGIQYGIHGIGDGQGAASFRTENLIVTNCLLDPGTTAGIQLENAGSRTAVTIANCYLATTSGTCLVLDRIGGAVSVSNCQFITGSYGGTGLSANDVRGLRAHGNIYTLLRQPVWLYKVAGFDVRDTIQGVADRPGDYPAVGISACSRGRIDCIVTGRSGSFTAAVEFKDGGCRKVEVCATGIDPGALGDPRRSIVHAGRAVNAPGAFGEGCLVSGILG